MDISEMSLFSLPQTSSFKVKRQEIMILSPKCESNNYLLSSTCYGPGTPLHGLYTSSYLTALMFNEAGTVHKPDPVTHLLKSSTGFPMSLGKIHSLLRAL